MTYGLILMNFLPPDNFEVYWKYNLIEEIFMGGLHPPLRTFFICDFVLQDKKKIFASITKIISGISV